MTNIKFNADMVIDIISATTTFCAFFFSQYQLWKQRKILIYNQKTMELRNEMLVIFDRIGHYSTKTNDNNIFSKSILTEYDTNFDYENKVLFSDIFNQIIKHNNQSLIKEFKFHRIITEFKKQFPDDEIIERLNGFG